MASLWGWVSYRTGSLWTSWGLHFANNIYLVLLIGNHDDVTNPVSGIDFVYAHPDADNVLATSLFGTALTAVAVWYLILRRFPKELPVPPASGYADHDDLTTHRAPAPTIRSAVPQDRVACPQLNPLETWPQGQDLERADQVGSTSKLHSQEGGDAGSRPQ